MGWRNIMAWYEPGENVKLDQAKFIDMTSLSGDSVFNVAALEVRRDLTIWLVG